MAHQRGRAMRAAGAVLWRRTRDGTEVCVLHRPRYDDWTLPKGKAHSGEQLSATALREVEEETGCSGRLGADLGAVSYAPAGDVNTVKVVRYWSMEAGPCRPLHEAHAFPAEVDAILWLPTREAGQRLSYSLERQVLERFRDTVSPCPSSSQSP